MNKKTRKLLTWCLVVSMVLTQMLFTNMAFASTRTSGDNRYMTAIAISSSQFASADTVIIARGDAPADALAAAPLAAQLKAPILLTETGALSDGVLAEIQRLKAKSAIIVGGTGAVSANVESALVSAGLTADRISGTDRYATSLAIAKRLANVSAVAVVNGNDQSFADALSISAIAAAKGMAIVSTDGKSASSDAAAYISGKKAYVVGGFAVVSDSVVSGATRLSGDDRYATNVAVINAFASDLKFDNVFVATGEDYPDALAGSVVAAVNKAPIVLVGGSLSSATSDLLKSKTTAASKFVVFGGVSAVSASVASAIDAINGGNNGPVSVSSVKAVAADTLEVALSAVPADTSKVVFTVQRETTPITVTTSWNGSVATLKYSSKFPQGNYTVNVKNNATDLGTSNVTIDQEKVAKIEVTTDKFAITSDGKQGYFTYKVMNQYSEDITNKNLASITWTIPGVTAGNYVESSEAKGVILATADANFNFLNLSSITITGVDNSANVVISKSLSVTASVGTLSNIKLGDVSNVNNKALQAGLSGEKWNISFEASDLAGNKTDNYVLLQGGLLDQNQPAVNDEVKLSTSGYITAKVVNISGHGKIELTVDPSADQLATDVPVTVTAITKNGATSTINLTLKRKSMPTTFTLMAPTEDVAYGDSKEVPFVCYDADGSQLTNFDDIVDATSNQTYANKYLGSKANSISLSPVFNGTEGLYFVQRGDGTAKLMYSAPVSAATTDMQKTLTATTNSGKFSTVTINVRRNAAAATMTVSDSSIFNRMAAGASIRIKHQWFTAKDQYGRAMDLTAYNPNAAGSLYVKAEVLNTSATNPAKFNFVVNSSPSVMPGVNGAVPNYIADQNNHLFVNVPAGTTAGTQTLKFSLIATVNSVDANNNPIVVEKAIATKTIDFTVVSMDDITGITMDAAVNTDTIYDTNLLAADNPVNALNLKYRNAYKVFGLDTNGNKVILPVAQTFVVSAGNQYLTTAAEYLNDGAKAISSADDFNKIQLASKYDEASWTSPVTVSTAIVGTTTNVRSTSFTIKGSEDPATAKSITAAIGSLDEIKTASYENGARLTDAIVIKDQYGKNMLEREDNSVQVYVDGVLQNITVLNNNAKYLYDKNAQGNNFDPYNCFLGSLAGHTVTVVANNGQSVTSVIK